MKINQGAVTLIYMSLITLISVLLLTIGYSRFMLALKRSEAFYDSIQTSYRAESEINNFLAQLIGGYLTSDNFPISEEMTFGDTRVSIDAWIEDNSQIIDVTASRFFAVNKIRAVRQAESAGSLNSAEMILTLDCTGSMGSSSGSGEGTSRLQEQTKAVLGFIDNLADSDYAENARVGVAVFGRNANWLTDSSGHQVRPDAGMSIAEVRQAVVDGFTNPSGSAQLSRSRDQSICTSLVDDGTNIGAGINIMNTYFENNPLEEEDIKLVEILISDGEPNSYISENRCLSKPGCTICSGSAAYDPLNYLKCTLSDWDTEWMSGRIGMRDPEIDAYVVTVFRSPPAGVVSAIETYSTQYYNAAYAHQLSEILEDIFENIQQSFARTTISRIIPTPEE